MSHFHSLHKAHLSTICFGKRMWVCSPWVWVWVRTSKVCRVGQSRIYTPYMTVYLVISLPKIPYVDRIYMILANPKSVHVCVLHLRTLHTAHLSANCVGKRMYVCSPWVRVWVRTSKVCMFVCCIYVPCTRHTWVLIALAKGCTSAHHARKRTRVAAARFHRFDRMVASAHLISMIYKLSV